VSFSLSNVCLTLSHRCGQIAAAFVLVVAAGRNQKHHSFSASGAGSSLGLSSRKDGNKNLEADELESLKLEQQALNSLTAGKRLHSKGEQI
jgi:hypothetical protein